LSVRRGDAVSSLGIRTRRFTNPTPKRLLLRLYVEQKNSRDFPHSSLLGDIADDKYFRKVNDSDATQFGLMFPSIPAHGEGERVFGFDPEREPSS
jgi:hypothetical protein